MQNQKIKKLYYSISEVSQITSLKKYVLRYWETEFPELKPAKNRAGNRIYTLEDIKTIFLLKKLLYAEKYTLEGAKKQIEHIFNTDDVQMNLSFDEMRREDTLLELKNDIIELLDFLNNNEDKSEDITE